MKKIFFLFLVLALVGAIGGVPAFSQNTNYGNEWINLSNTYKKVIVGKPAIYKITAAQLSNLGFSGIAGSQFALFRDGREVPIYTSTSGVFDTSDYILFYGYGADGKTNKDLFLNPDFQGNVDVNLFTDSTAYFLTFDNQIHKRLTRINNSIPTPEPSAATFCLSTIRSSTSPRFALNPGASYDQSNNFYSPQFDNAEGYVLNTASQLSRLITFATVNRYLGAGQPNVTASFNVNSFTRLTSNVHNLSVKLSGSSISSVTFFDTSFSGYHSIKKTISIPSNPGNNGTHLTFTDNQNFGIYYATIKYGRTFSFSGDYKNQIAFSLPSDAARYLKITNFNLTNANPPLLIDKTDQKIYSGIVDGTTLKFYLDADTGEREFYLSSFDSVVNLANFKDVHFRNYLSAGNEGNYVILTHKDYIQAQPDYVQEYADYRQSQAGGSFSPVVVDVTELYDQFGYGYWGDPLSVRRFIKFIQDQWQTKPEYLFIIGKGITYDKYISYRSNPTTYPFPIVPTWGQPGSDNLLSATVDGIEPTLITGRLSVYNNQEIGDYLNKVTAYEQVLKSPPIPSVENDLWKKNALHIAGASDIDLQTSLLSALNSAAAIYKDTLVGGIVTTIAKNSTDPVANIDDPTIDSLVNSGVNIITFYGHASGSGFDYNLNDPSTYHSNPRFPIFLAFGCDVAQIYDLTATKTISENYIHSSSGGSVAMIAEDNLGYTGTLTGYMRELYKGFSYIDYGKSFGQQYLNNIGRLLAINSGDFTQIHIQCLLYQGDPALSLYNPGKPDYVIEQDGVSSIPANVTTANDSFTVRAVVYNLGKVLNDTVAVVLNHTHPGNNTITFTDTVKLIKLLNQDTVLFRVPIDKVKDIGLNNLTIKIDADNKYDELSEQNNQVGIQVFIGSDNLVPVYPPEFSIVYQQGVILKASTLNPFSPVARYRFQIDTTEKFNSPLLQQTQVTSSGGILTWTPNLSMTDSVVYYWRTAVDSLVNGNYNWSNSSFIYLAHGSDGWNQSHYYQYQKDDLQQMSLPESSRKFTFSAVQNKLFIQNIVAHNSNNWPVIFQSLNNVILQNWGCYFQGSVQIMVIDSASGRPWANTQAGLYGSIGANCGLAHNDFSFQFPTGTFEGRDSAIKMLERVPEGDYVMVSNLLYTPQWLGATIDAWKADTAVLGSGHSLYHSMKALGFDQIDSFTSKKAFIFFRKKGDANYPVYQEITPTEFDTVTLLATFNSYSDSATLNSTVIGPSLDWKQLIWKLDPTVPLHQNDISYVSIYGIKNDGQETQLYEGTAKDTSLSFINASVYPNIRMVWNDIDSIDRTSANLKYWRVLYQPVPEAALNPNKHFSIIDSLDAGQTGKMSVCIENLSPFDMDSMLVKYKIIDAQNISHDLPSVRYRKLPANDTLIATLDYNANAFSGNNLLYIEANPNNDQPEQYHPNNIGYAAFSQAKDNTVPILDVTFDGVHILDKDIVSAKPFIKILLREDNPYLLLNDTSLIQVQLQKPDGSAPITVPFDGSTCIFIPASQGGKDNEARVEYRPDLMDDGLYKLIVSGKNTSGTSAEKTPAYEVQFTVENKPTITNVLNYPNPFSTSTQFVFTMTGSQIPSQFKIQILSVTGKVVREITKDELGPLHIGRNITEYHWDGRDQYGQLLGNGVYLYRVVTSLNGNAIEHRNNTDVDKFFTKGYGKLYIMR